MSFCPTHRQLERLLAEQLPGPDRDAVEAHVEGCSTCQDRLDRLVGRPPAPPAPRAGGRPEVAALEPGDDFLDRLRQWPPAVSAVGRLGTARLGQYEILGALAKGGMGAVYKARHVELGKVVALKVLPAEQVCEANIARFKQEARAMGRLEHPNIVAAYDAGEHGGVRYLVMALVDGIDLGRLIDRRSPLPVADACELARQAALGLQHAFERGLVHRDVKPQNLMLARDGTVKVLDLGLARSFGDAAADPLTAAGSLLGTADYLAPEQWDSPHAADTRADIYALGCTLYHLVAGRPPFADGAYKTVLAKMRAHQEVPPPPVTGPRPDAPTELAAVLDRMLAKDPAGRFASPAEVAAALRPFAVGADLGRLLDATATGPLPPAEAAVTPNPATLDTAGGSVRGRPAQARRRYALPLALAGLFAATAVAAVAVWPRGGRPEVPATPPGAGDRPAVPATSLVAIDELRVNLYRGKEGKPLGDIRLTDTEVRVGDDVRVFAKLGAPANCYLVAFNPDGTEQLCHPAWDGDNPQQARAVRPEKMTEVRFFPDDRGVFGLDSAGLQAFVLVASTQPLPPYAEWQARAGKIPWKPVPRGGAWRWEYDGRGFDRLPKDRGTRRERKGVPEALNGLCEFFKNRSEFEAVRIIAFPISGNGG